MQDLALSQSAADPPQVPDHSTIETSEHAYAQSGIPVTTNEPHSHPVHQPQSWRAQVRYFEAMAALPDWMKVRERFAALLYSQAPLPQRLESLRAEIRALECGTDLSLELDSMARSAADNREAPFLDVGKDLITYCDSRLYQEMGDRGEDARGLLEFLECKRKDEEMRRRKASGDPVDD
jgi:hypothetical protein